MKLVNRDAEQEFIAIRKSAHGFVGLIANQARVTAIFGELVLNEKATLKIVCFIRRKERSGMVNLIWKDVVIQKKVLVIMFSVLFVYVLLNISSIWVGVLLSIAFIMNAFAMDEKSSIHMLLNSLPYTRREIVSSKYIGAFLFTTLVVFTIFIVNVIIHHEIMVWKDMLFIVGLVMVAISFLFPLSYKFESKYILIASIIFFMIYMLVVNFMPPDLNEKIRGFAQVFITSQSTSFYLLIALLVMVLYVCSWLLSLRIYERKVF